MKLFDTTFSAIQNAMDLEFKRHAILTSNVANAETPGYRARELDFAGELQAALGSKDSEMVKTSPQHMDLGGDNLAAHITFDDSGTIKSDGNNVDLELEMGKISSNARGYQNATTLMSMKLALLRAATQSRGG